MNTLIYIAGTTAIGKTALAIKLAKHYNCEIISCDSRQFFKEMTIGTAVPEPEELSAVAHHFIQNISIFDQYSVGQFERDALAKLDELFAKNAIQIMVGGSGLYADAVIKGLDYFPDVPSEIREQLNKDLEHKGIASLQDRLKALDPESYNSIAIDNPHRLIRALEICIGTGQTYASFKNKAKPERHFKTIIVGLTAEREVIYKRINKRVDIMLDKGLLKEVEGLYTHRELNALQTVGYRELFAYFDGRYDFDFAISEIKKNTRRFAKRQLTWLKRYEGYEHVFWFDYQTELRQVLSAIETQIPYPLADRKGSQTL